MDAGTGMSWSFTIPGTPVPKGRPRHNTKTNTTYTPDRTTRAEQQVALHFRQSNVGYGPPKPGRFKLACTFYVKTDTADIDNLLKTVMDGLQGVAYLNDNQVKALGECEIRLDRGHPRIEGYLELIE